jgi:class 3 adenylate cyclase
VLVGGRYRTVGHLVAVRAACGAVPNGPRTPGTAAAESPASDVYPQRTMTAPGTGSDAATDAATNGSLLDPRTLRFRDPRLELEYQTSAIGQVRRETVAVIPVSIGLWLLAGVLLPAFTPIPANVSTPVVLFMTVVLLVAIVPTRRVNTLGDVARVVIPLNILTATAILVLAVQGDAFERYAGPAIMLQSIFVVIGARRFVLSALLLATESVLLAAAAFATGLLAAYVVDLFLVVSTLAVTVGITYVLESTARTAWYQRRLIAELHAQVDRLFHQYLSPDVAAALLAEPGRAELGGELVEVSVLFVDLQGFTAYSERTSPGNVVGLLNEYFEAIVPIVFAEGGTVVQFAGDALMAIFNAPVRQPDHALHAARAALALQAAVGAIAADDPTRPRFRAGVNTGPVVVGNIGGQQMRNFTAIGDTTNLAARLQTFASPGQVVIGETTYAQIRGIARVRPLGTPALKGKSEPVAAYELLGLDLAAAPAPVPAST